MTYEQYIQVMRDLYAAGFTTRINYKMYDDETQLPRMTPEEREK